MFQHSPPFHTLRNGGIHIYVINFVLNSIQNLKIEFTENSKFYEINDKNGLKSSRIHWIKSK